MTDDKVHDWLTRHITMKCANGMHATNVVTVTANISVFDALGALCHGGIEGVCACPCHGKPWPRFVVEYLERQHNHISLSDDRTLPNL